MSQESLAALVLRAPPPYLGEKCGQLENGGNAAGSRLNGGPASKNGSKSIYLNPIWHVRCRVCTSSFA